MATVVNHHAAGRVFVKCTKSNVTKLPPVKVPKGKFTMSAESRGKELMMKLQSVPLSADKPQKPVYILFNMGMTGFFESVPSSKACHQHAHLRFYATDGSVLSCVDQRRFGKWRSQKTPDWPCGRGPDPVRDHTEFVLGVQEALGARPRHYQGKPICEALHDQRLFNGIGNYLRAEILFRAGVPPFACSYEVLMNTLKTSAANGRTNLLKLCRDVPLEVIKMNLSKYQGGNKALVEETDSDHGRWERWLRVYGRGDASWALDSDGRRIWFRGRPGKLYASHVHKGHLGGVAESSHNAAALRSAKDYFARTPAANNQKTSPARMKRPAASSKRSTRVKVIKKPASTKLRYS
eukprot:TRINITY_DN8599_c0_g1_i1.p1 TRINITY_DN8599_c0_g1~~TRINITY_DN8599_c0_g1_i1.p1  ORF type:complete len:381 (+),score=40.42 TRINITY_DN8599_c0_g1_i1:94-1143(+)